MPWDATDSAWYDDCLDGLPVQRRRCIPQDQGAGSCLLIAHTLPGDPPVAWQQLLADSLPRTRPIRREASTDRPLTLDYVGAILHPIHEDPRASFPRRPSRDLGGLAFEGGDPIPDAEPHAALWPEAVPLPRRNQQRQAPGENRHHLLPSDPEPPEAATSGTAPGRRPRRSPPADLDMPGRFFDFAWTDSAWAALTAPDLRPVPQRRPTASQVDVSADLAGPDRFTIFLPAIETDHQQPRRHYREGSSDRPPTEVEAPGLQAFMVDGMPRGGRHPRPTQEVIVSAQVLREAWPLVLGQEEPPRRIGARVVGETVPADPSAARIAVVLGTGQESGTGDAALLQPVEQQPDMVRRPGQAPGDCPAVIEGAWVLSEVLGAVWHGEHQRPTQRLRGPVGEGGTAWTHGETWVGPELVPYDAPPMPRRERPAIAGQPTMGLPAELPRAELFVGLWPDQQQTQPRRALRREWTERGEPDNLLPADLTAWLHDAPAQAPRRTAQQPSGAAEPSWLGAGVIVVTGPYGAVAAEIYTAGAVAAVMSQEG